MINKSFIPPDIFDTIVDSLNDFTENWDNAANASEGSARAFFTEQATRSELVRDQLNAGFNMGTLDVSVILEALELSILNCTEQGLDAALEDYVTAKVFVQTEMHR